MSAWLDEHQTGKALSLGGYPVAILHVDMDAFFAAIEQRDNPELRGKPVIIGGGPPPWQKQGPEPRQEDKQAGREAPWSRRGVVTTCSYEARAFGVHSGMPIVEAWRLCPNGIYMPGSHGKYGDASRRVMSVLERFSPDVEPVSVDEAFIDVTHSQYLFGNPWAIARSIQRQVKEETDLTCSVGIGGHRLLAKMASKMRKPAGIFEIPAERAREIFAPMPVLKMHGIGPSTAKALQKLGIHTLGELAEYPDRVLVEHFGPAGARSLKMRARGEGGRVTRPFGNKDVEKSIGHERTFGRNITTMESLEAELLDLVERVCRRMRAGGYIGTLVNLRLRDAEFVTLHRQAPLSEPGSCESQIFDTARLLLRQNWVCGSPVRLLGVSVGRLLPAGDGNTQGHLWFGEQRCKEAAIGTAMDELQGRWGSRLVSRCSAAMRHKVRK